MSTTQTAPNPQDLSLKDMAAAAKSDRNRAVDLYRAIAMLAVAFGHWAAIVIMLDPATNEIIGGNALDFNAGMSWMSWPLQVMPLFFVVGGFSSAISLDSHNAKGGRPQDWVVARLRRMTAPAVLLATVWVALIAVGYAVGQGDIIKEGAVAAAIPLWFLSNYTIDTAIAPYVLPLFRKNPKVVVGTALAVYLGFEALRFVEVGGVLGALTNIRHINWVLGWLLFQVMGFAYRDGLLPTGAKLAATAAAFWAAAAAAVTVGPYPMSMVHFDKIVESPTYPPSLALMLFGAAYSCTALFFAPAVTKFLASNKKAWSIVVGANGIALSVYLWHMTAAVVASAIFYVMGWLPSADVGTAQWWLEKAPLMAASTVILALIVSKVSAVERKSLLAPRTPWNGGQASMLAAAIFLSVGVKVWVNGTVGAVLLGCGMVLLVWYGAMKAADSPKAVA